MEKALYLVALRSDEDPEYQKHKSIFLKCNNKKHLPTDTANYFDVSDENIKHDPRVVSIKLEIDLEDGIHIQDYDGDERVGWEIELSKLPPGVARLRFYRGPDEDAEKP